VSEIEYEKLNGVGMAWEWRGNGVGMAWEWCGNGVGMDCGEWCGEWIVGNGVWGIVWGNGVICEWWCVNGADWAIVEFYTSTVGNSTTFYMYLQNGVEFQRTQSKI
jgi:hypothetical protein